MIAEFLQSMIYGAIVIGFIFGLFFIVYSVYMGYDWLVENHPTIALLIILPPIIILGLFIVGESSKGLFE